MLQNILYPAIFFAVFVLLLWIFADMPLPGRRRRLATATARAGRPARSTYDPGRGPPRR